MTTNRKQPSGARSAEANAVKLPPVASDIEQKVLGAILYDNQAYETVADLLTPACFGCEKHRITYTAMQQLAEEGAPIMPTTLADKLAKMGELETVGGYYFVATLSADVTFAEVQGIEYHTRILLDKALNRSLIDYSAEISIKAYDETTDVGALLEQAEERIYDIANSIVPRTTVPLGQALGMAFQEMHTAALRDDKLSGLATGFQALDKITSGLQSKDLIIIAARPAMGKTALVITMATYMALRHRTPIAFFSLEMSVTQLAKRIIANVCAITGDKVRTGQLDATEWQRLCDRMPDYYDLPLYLEEAFQLSVSTLRSRAKRLVTEKGVQLIIVDYLQLLSATGGRMQSREQEVAAISRALKGIAMELGVPVVALSQLNRAVESRTGEAKRPQLSDLRESGGIEQDADLVCFIHRPEYYKIYEDTRGNDLRGKAEIIIAKHRNGAVGEFHLRFNSELALFGEIA